MAERHWCRQADPCPLRIAESRRKVTALQCLPPKKLKRQTHYLVWPHRWMPRSHYAHPERRWTVTSGVYVGRRGGVRRETRAWGNHPRDRQARSPGLVREGARLAGATRRPRPWRGPTPLVASIRLPESRVCTQCRWRRDYRYE